jgi:uncharacterized protein YjbI with pentapeptide repeats
MMESEARVCEISMPGDRRCGRPIHAAPLYDDAPVCLMHSKDPAKDRTEFQEELERIISTAALASTSADFTEFVFAQCDFRGKKFATGCTFIQATFYERADFASASFGGDAYFYEAKFMCGADFSHARFTRHGMFMRTEFHAESLFAYAWFESEAIFMSAMFEQKAEFDHARFGGEARFSGARFNRNAIFLGARFHKSAEFRGTRFARLAKFHGAEFQGSLEFHETRFRHDLADSPGLDFSSVEMESPEKVKFYRTDLGQALIFQTDISRVDFALVEWRDRGRVRNYRTRRALLRIRLALEFWAKPTFSAIRKELILARQPRWAPRLCLFEEDVSFLSEYHIDLFTDAHGRNCGLIAEIYQQLKRNYDSKGDYWIAGHWHYGEMEMKRLYSQWPWRPLRQLSSRISLIALYKYASAYGESYLMPLLWLAFFVVAFAFLYPIAGLEFNPPVGAPGWLGYKDWATFFWSHPAEHPSGFWGMILHSLMTSLSVAGFQREFRYAPSYPWGRMLALLELLLTTTLGGLFLLAIRRQFKRS